MLSVQGSQPVDLSSAGVLPCWRAVATFYNKVELQRLQQYNTIQDRVHDNEEPERDSPPSSCKLATSIMEGRLLRIEMTDCP